MVKGVSHDKSSIRIREKILADKRLHVERGKLSHKLPTDPTGCKTTLMLYVEDKWRKPIEELIWQDTAEQVANNLEVSVRQIYRWRKLFPLPVYKVGKNNRKCPINMT